MPRTIGLDIGSSQILAVQLNSGRVPSLEKVAFTPTPEGAIKEGAVADAALLADALKGLWSQAKFKGREVALGVANPQVFTRTVELDWYPEPEFREGLEFQVGSEIPIPADEAVLDYHLIERFDVGDTERARVLLIAAQRDMTQAFVDVAKRAKLTPVELDLNAFAMLRALNAASPADAVDAEALIDAGANRTEIVVHRGGSPLFVRSVAQGGDAVTNEIVRTIGMTPGEAEEYKREVGLAQSSQEQDELDNLIDEPQADEVAQVIDRVAEAFVTEVMQSLDYYAATKGAAPVVRARLVGGAGQLPGLRERMADAMNIPVLFGQPLEGLDASKAGIDPYQLQSLAPRLAVAVGLAMGAAE